MPKKHEKEKENEKERDYVGAEGGAVGLDDPAGFTGEVAEDFVDVGAWGEAVTAVLPQSIEDLSGDGSSLSLSHLRLLLVTLAPPSSTSQHRRRRRRSIRNHCRSLHFSLSSLSLSLAQSVHSVGVIDL